MPKINAETIPWKDTRSPKGTYQVSQRDLSLALRGMKDTGTWGGGHPFDVAQAKIPPGASNWPLHVHTTQWEMYLFTAGTGELREGEITYPVGPGDCCLLPPGEAHQVRNTGSVDLEYLVIADNPQAEIVTYPASNKWMIKPQRKFFEMQEVDYYRGEE
ncbi:MAG TPA: cupin domain-containing protein [Stenomitos sp.]